MTEARPHHPDLRVIAALLRRGGGRAPKKVNRRFDRFMLELPRKGISIERTGEASVRLYQGEHQQPSSPALLWIHGGGYVGGFAAMDDSFCRAVTKELGIVVASVEYRRAPEHPFPVPLHDCHDALEWLADRDTVDRSRIAIGGASAGGGLAAGLALLARERGAVVPGFQLLSYPMLDDRTVLRRDIDETHFRLWNNAKNAFGWSSYLNAEPGSDAINALAAPARERDLAGLPAAWIGVGTDDLFYDEAVEYASRLRAAGVSAELLVVDGAFHAFDAVWRQANVSRRYRAAQIAALDKALRAD
jgi:acetyl esterase/lipase